MRSFILALIIVSLAACQSKPPDANAYPAPDPAAVPANAVSIEHGVENRVDGCTVSTFYIMNVKGTPTARATWHCEGEPPHDPQELVKGDCIKLSTQRWCVHDVVVVKEDSNAPGSSEDRLVLLPQ